MSFQSIWSTFQIQIFSFKSIGFINQSPLTYMWSKHSKLRWICEVRRPGDASAKLLQHIHEFLRSPRWLLDDPPVVNVYWIQKTAGALNYVLKCERTKDNFYLEYFIFILPSITTKDFVIIDLHIMFFSLILKLLNFRIIIVKLNLIGLHHTE